MTGQLAFVYLALYPGLGRLPGLLGWTSTGAYAMEPASFDKEVAPGYAPPRADIHHPTGYWLTPALIALQHDIPLVWNAPGMHCNDLPAWAAPLLRAIRTWPSCWPNSRRKTWTAW